VYRAQAHLLNRNHGLAAPPVPRLLPVPVPSCAVLRRPAPPAAASRTRDAAGRQSEAPRPCAASPHLVL